MFQLPAAARAGAAANVSDAVTAMSAAAARKRIRRVRVDMPRDGRDAGFHNPFTGLSGPPRLPAAAHRRLSLTTVRFRVLGPWETGDVLVPPGRLRILLVALLLNAGRPVSMEALAGRLWPEDEPASVRGTVHTYVTRLRRLLGRDLIRTAGRGGYQLDVPPGDVDLHRFRELLRRSRDAAGPEPELRLLREALALWRGPALSRRRAGCLG